MWTGSGKASRQRGLTLVEVTLALMILAGIAMLVDVAVGSTMRTERVLDAMRTTTQRGQQLTYELAQQIGTARRFFQSDDTGLAYLGALDLKRDALDPHARLPGFDENHDLGVDAPDEPYTGNILLFIQESDPLPCVAVAATKELRYIDTYRFTAIYPSVVQRRLVRTDPTARDLVVWRSRRYANRTQILEIPAGQMRESVVRDLYRRHDVRASWSPDEDVGTAFFRMDDMGRMEDTPLLAPVIEEDQDLSDRGRLLYAKLRLAPTDAQAGRQREVMTSSAPGALDPWHPDGFELKLTGTSLSRQVWMRLVLEAPVPGLEETVVQEFTLIVNARDI